MGLGNPGPEYEDTRHNAGFRLADHLAARWRAAPFRRADRSRETRASVAGVQVRLLKPWTYMNRSGAALAPLRDVSGFDPARHLLVLVDEEIPAKTLEQIRSIQGLESAKVVRI